MSRKPVLSGQADVWVPWQIPFGRHCSASPRQRCGLIMPLVTHQAGGAPARSRLQPLGRAPQLSSRATRQKAWAQCAPDRLQTVRSIYSTQQSTEFTHKQAKMKTAAKLKEPKEKIKKHCDTGASRAIPQRTTGPAQPSLTSVIGREPVLYGWYDRSMPDVWACVIYTGVMLLHEGCSMA